MDIGLIVILLLVGVIVGWHDRYAVQRTYADDSGAMPALVVKSARSKSWARNAGSRT